MEEWGEWRCLWRLCAYPTRIKYKDHKGTEKHGRSGLAPTGRKLAGEEANASFKRLLRYWQMKIKQPDVLGWKPFPAVGVVCTASEPPPAVVTSHRPSLGDGRPHAGHQPW